MEKEKLRLILLELLDDGAEEEEDIENPAREQVEELIIYLIKVGIILDEDNIINYLNLHYSKIIEVITKYNVNCAIVIEAYKESRDKEDLSIIGQLTEQLLDILHHLSDIDRINYSSILSTLVFSWIYIFDKDILIEFFASIGVTNIDKYKEYVK